MKTWDDMLEQMEKDTAIPEKVRERYIKTLENLPEKKKVKKIPAPVKAAAILLGVLALVGGGIYAAGQTKNIQWFLHRTGNQIPAEADLLVDKEVQVLKTVQSGAEIVDVTVEETVCDAHSMLALVRISAKDKEKYLLVPEGTTLDTYIYTILPESDSRLTVEAYAREHQLQIVAVDAWFTDAGDWKITEADTSEVDNRAESVTIENTAAGELVCLLEASKKAETKKTEVTIHVTAQLDENMDNVQENSAADAAMQGEMDTVVAVSDLSSENVAIYEPKATEELEAAGLHIYEVKVYRTEFRTYMVIEFVIDDKDTLVEFTRLDEAGQEKKFVDRSGGGTDDADGHKQTVLIYDTEETDYTRFYLTYIVRDAINGTNLSTGEVALIKE